MNRKYKSRDDSSATAGSRRRSTSTNSGPPTSSATTVIGFDPFQRREDRFASNRPSTSSAPAVPSVEIQQPLQMIKRKRERDEIRRGSKPPQDLQGESRRGYLHFSQNPQQENPFISKAELAYYTTPQRRPVLNRTDLENPY